MLLHTIIKILTIISISFLASRLEASCFTNFDKPVCLDLTFLPRVIIKTPLSKDQIKKKLQRPVKQLAFLGKNNLFLIEHEQAVKYANELKNREYIIYAQPDILQKKHNQKYKNVNLTSLYKLDKAWNKTKGKGIKVAIIDDGFNLTHKDLKGVKVAFEYDVEQKILNSSPKISLDKHGTQVAGIIFAQHNKFGIDGIAPEAELIAIRQISNITSQNILAFTVADMAGADIVNCSWKSPTLLQPVYDVISYLSKHGRKGKGTAIVFSAGNRATEILPYTTEASIDEAIVVGATQSYSNYGKSVDFIIPSGIKTTRENGYGIFNGTSATAPVISGLLALKMAENKQTKTNIIVKQLKEELNVR